ncbi:helix-turn-helix domain-containing protein [Bacillus safensis]|uniref:helix-turn-helix transcriptional regulator n=1 Tax=Bacillus TaxID=1386 RepID=UPI00203DA8A1|nr:helix-turn-helix transcriptional regulator [Bacillus safensis]MCM3026287.1 helix-turn-helix domain-containing protein [Bacillus safensis]
MKLENLREERILQGKTQTYMAKKLGYKYTSGYANIEMGRTKPSLEIAKHIADLLNTGVQELFFGQKLHEKSNFLKEDQFLEKGRRAE